MDTRDPMPMCELPQNALLYPLSFATSGFSFIELRKSLNKDRCNKIIGQYENIDCAEFACLLINLLTT
jgi:hypothetical protein